MEKVGHLELQDNEVAVCGIVLVVLLSTSSKALMVDHVSIIGIIGPGLAFLIGGIVEAFEPGIGAANVGKRIGKAVVAYLLGFIGFFVLFVLAFQTW